MPEESTAPDSVELTRTFYETMDRDWDFDALAGFFAPDAVWDLSESHLGIYEGVAAIGDFLVGYWATWEDHHHEIDEILDLGHGVLSVAIREDGCPRGSNARAQARHLQVFEWVQGEIVRITGYPDIDAARAAAERLAEERGEAMSQENVDVVVRVMRRFNELGVQEGASEDFDPEVEFDWSNSDAPDGAVYHDLAEWRAVMQSRTEELTEQRFEEELL